MKNTVLVTTEFRGVFFGEVIKKNKLPDEITLKNARNVIYWSKDCNGFFGLASTGITGNCKISSKVDQITLYKITSVTSGSKEALKTWEALN
jgi:hypothetical protein